MRVKSVKRIIHDTPKQFYDVINAAPYNNFLIKTNTSYIVSHNCFADEVSFQPNSDVEKQIQKSKNLVNTAIARMQSRFMKGENNPTIMIIASSKRTEQSYMETFIAEKKANESKTTYIVDEPQWVIRTDKDSDKKFKVAVGNKFLASELLPLNATEEDAKIYRNRGYSIIDVPIGYYENFRDDIDVALTDIAGISTTNLSKYISGARLAECKTDRYQNPFTKEIIEVGNAKEDTAQYSDFFDLSRVDPNMKYKPLFVHLDMSISGDKTGIAGVWIKGKRPSSEAISSNDLYYQLAFAVSIKAPKGHQISFEKNRIFIRWLKEQGFNVKGISTDTFQSYDTGQALKTEGFAYDIVSVDKVTPEHICVPYQYFKSVIYEKRIEMFEDVLLTEEIINLERNNNSGKVDHPSNGSKDKSDAVCGSIYNASKHAEEFAFDYGETIDIILDTNTANNQNITKEQISVDFQKELARAFDPLTQKLAAGDSSFVDFGMGKAEIVNSVYANDGILLW